MDEPRAEIANNEEFTVTEELLAGVEAKLDTVILWLQIIAGLIFAAGFIGLVG